MKAKQLLDYEQVKSLRASLGRQEILPRVRLRASLGRHAKASVHINAKSLRPSLGKQQQSLSRQSTIQRAKQLV